MKIVGTIARVFTWLCIATVIAQLIGVAVLWFRGALTTQRRAEIMAVLLDLDLKQLGATAMANSQVGGSPANSQQPTVESRVASSRDLLFRSDTLKGGLDSVGGFQAGLRVDRQHFENLRVEFGILLTQLETQVRTAALLEVQHTLELLKPKDAKTQLLRMLDDGALSDVVAIVKAMPLEKRRKILREFKTAAESQRLHQILIETGKSEAPAAEPGQETPL